MLIGKNTLTPKNDYIFKRIFGYIGNEEITKALISSIVDNINIRELTLDCKEILEQDLRDDKLGILDIRAVIDNSVQCNIEMQVVDNKDMINRLLFYWSRLYLRTIKKGEDYLETQRTIIILFADYELSELKEIHKYFSKWHICEDEYKNTLLTSKFEIYIIELPKYKKYPTDSKLSKWVKFINNPKEVTMEDVKDNKPLEDAMAAFDLLFKDDEESERAVRRMIAEMDKKAYIATGLEKGVEKAKIETAKKMLAKGIDIETIIECTELTKEEIEKIRENK